MAVVTSRIFRLWVLLIVIIVLSGVCDLDCTLYVEFLLFLMCDEVTCGCLFFNC